MLGVRVSYVMRLSASQILSPAVFEQANEIGLNRPGLADHDAVHEPIDTQLDAEIAPATVRWRGAHLRMVKMYIT